MERNFKIQFAILVQLLLVFSAQAQLNFQKSVTVSGQQMIVNSMVAMADSGLLISLNASYQSCLIRYDASGNILWKKNLENSSFVTARSINKTNDGGSVMSFNTIPNSSQGYDMGVARFDANGNLIWSNAYGNLSDDQSGDAIQTANGDFVSAGSSIVSNFQQGALVRTLQNGSMTWSKTYRDTTAYTCSIAKVVETPGQNLVALTNSFYGNAPANGYDGGIIKTDANGNVIWSKVYHNHEWNQFDDIKILPDGGFFVSGVIDINLDGVGNRDLFLMRTDSLGNIIWANAYVKLNDDFGCKLTLTNDGGCIITGVLNSLSSTCSCVVIKVNSNGSIDWTNQFFPQTTSPSGNITAQAPNNGYFVLTTRQVSLVNSGYLIRINENGSGYCNDSPTSFVTTPVVLPYTSPIISGAGINATPLSLTVTVPTVNETVICVPSGLNEENSNLISNCFPNPSSNGTFTININGPSPEFKCYNVYGQNIAITISNSKTNEYKISNLPVGVYLLNVSSSKLNSSVKLIVMN